MNNHPAGANLLISTDSDDVQVQHNVFVAQGTLKPVNVNLGSFSGDNVSVDDNIFWGYQVDLYPKPRPILYAYYGSYESIDLNEASVRVSQARNIHYNPGYPALRTFNPDPSRFPTGHRQRCEVRHQLSHSSSGLRSRGPAEGHAHGHTRTGGRVGGARDVEHLAREPNGQTRPPRPATPSTKPRS